MCRFPLLPFICDAEWIVRRRLGDDLIVSRSRFIEEIGLCAVNLQSLDWVKSYPTGSGEWSKLSLHEPRKYRRRGCSYTFANQFIRVEPSKGVFSRRWLYFKIVNAPGMNASLGRFVRNRQARVLPAAIFLRKEQSARSTKQLSQEHISQMQNDASQRYALFCWSYSTQRYGRVFVFNFLLFFLISVKVFRSKKWLTYEDGIHFISFLGLIDLYTSKENLIFKIDGNLGTPTMPEWKMTETRYRKCHNCKYCKVDWTERSQKVCFKMYKNISNYTRVIFPISITAQLVIFATICPTIKF